MKNNGLWIIGIVILLSVLIIFLNVSSQENCNCDYFPDYLENSETYDCCYEHDKCYEINDCTIKSWIPGYESEECEECNKKVKECMYNLFLE